MENQINFVSKEAYQGKNQVELRSAKKEFGFQSNEWLTFLQAKDSGLKIKKGSKGVTIFKGYTEYENKDEKTGKVSKESHSNGYSRVFNLDQTEKYEKSNV